MRTPSNRMFPHTALVERRPPAADPLTGNTPLEPYETEDTLRCHAHPIDDVVERQVLGTVEAPVTFRLRMGSWGSVVQLADRLTISTSGEKVLVAHIRNTNALNGLYVFDCYNEPA